MVLTITGSRTVLCAHFRQAQDHAAALDDDEEWPSDSEETWDDEEAS